MGTYVNFIAFSFVVTLLVVNNNCPHNCYQFHATTNCWSFWIMYELLSHSLLSFLMDLLLPLFFGDDVRPQKGRPLELTFEE